MMKYNRVMDWHKVTTIRIGSDYKNNYLSSWFEVTTIRIGRLKV